MDSARHTDWRCGLSQSANCDRHVRTRALPPTQLHQLFDVSITRAVSPPCSPTPTRLSFQTRFIPEAVGYADHPGPSISTRRGDDGVWQRFERGEIELWNFYVAFGRELSDTVRGNVWYREYCAQKGVGEKPRFPPLVVPSPFTDDC